MDQVRGNCGVGGQQMEQTARFNAVIGRLDAASEVLPFGPHLVGRRGERHGQDLRYCCCCPRFDVGRYVLPPATRERLSFDFYLPNTNAQIRMCSLPTALYTVQGSAQEWSLGCVNSQPVARGSREAGFTQPRDHYLAWPCVYYIHTVSRCYSSLFQGPRSIPKQSPG